MYTRLSILAQRTCSHTIAYYGIIPNTHTTNWSKLISAIMDKANYVHLWHACLQSFFALYIPTCTSHSLSAACLCCLPSPDLAGLVNLSPATAASAVGCCCICSSLWHLDIPLQCVCVCVCLEECDVRVGRTLVSRPWNTNLFKCVCVCVVKALWSRVRKNDQFLGYPDGLGVLDFTISAGQCEVTWMFKGSYIVCLCSAITVNGCEV